MPRRKVIRTAGFVVFVIGLALGLLARSHSIGWWVGVVLVVIGLLEWGLWLIEHVRRRLRPET
jgi:hypothetical protein